MPSPNYQIDLLNKQHDKQHFSCGIEPLDHYLKKVAGQDIRRAVTATYILSECNELEVAGYYTLSSTSIELDKLPDGTIKKLPRYPTLPATLLGRLAIDKNYQGKNLGELLLVDALKRSSDLSKKIGSVAVVVDAKNDAAVQFYLKYGLIQFESDPMKLFIMMKTVNMLF